MNKNVVSKSLLLTIAYFTFSCSYAQKKSDEVLMTIGNSKVTVAEFGNVYHKNKYIT